MIFRYARHTNNISTIVQFYTEILNMKVLGEFKNHNEYDGVFIGKNDENWHIEFTTSLHKTNRQPGKDDLLVFYFSKTEFENVLKK